MPPPGVLINKILSNAYSNENLPQDWADMTFLVPHESIRRQLVALQRSVEALPENTSTENSWKGILFSKWFMEVFHFVISQHHYALQQIYIPFLVEHKAQWPELNHSNVMTEMLHPINECCETIQTKNGIECTESIATLKELIPTFVQNLSEHMSDLESKIPPILRASATEKQNAAAVSKMIAFQGIQGLKKILPGILLANQEWMTRAYYAQYMKTLPPPVLKAQVTTLIPNYCHCYMRMRDAPLLSSQPVVKEMSFDGDASMLSSSRGRPNRT